MRTCYLLVLVTKESTDPHTLPHVSLIYGGKAVAGDDKDEPEYWHINAVGEPNQLSSTFTWRCSLDDPAKYFAGDKLVKMITVGQVYDVGYNEKHQLFRKLHSLLVRQDGSSVGTCHDWVIECLDTMIRWEVLDDKEANSAKSKLEECISMYLDKQEMLEQQGKQQKKGKERRSWFGNQAE